MEYSEPRRYAHHMGGAMDGERERNGLKARWKGGRVQGEGSRRDYGYRTESVT